MYVLQTYLREACEARVKPVIPPSPTFPSFPPDVVLSAPNWRYKLVNSLMYMLQVMNSKLCLVVCVLMLTSWSTQYSGWCKRPVHFFIHPSSICLKVV